MQSKEKDQQKIKVAQQAPSLDARDVAIITSNDEILPQELFESNLRNRLEINIVETTAEYQEVEVIYGNKKIRKRLTKFLPKDLASIVYQATQRPSPSAQTGAINLASLKHGNLFLQEKFLRILAKINQVSEIKTAEKIWDSNERISTAEKTILVAVVNRLRPESEKVDRVIVSSKSYEIPDQKSFRDLIADVLDLTKNSKKLMKILFGDLAENLPAEKKSLLEECLRSVIFASDESSRDHQIKFLQKITTSLGNNREISQ